MKKNSLWLGWLGFFAAGFLAGIAFSAWKLDSGVRAVQGSPAVNEQRNQQVELRAKIADLQKMLTAKPKDIVNLVLLGNCYFDAGDYSKAVGTYKKALQIDPRNADVMIDMGISYRKLGKPEESVKAFRQALAVNPEHPMALFNLGIVLRDDLKDDAGALKTWELFLKEAGNSPHAVMVRPWVKQLKEKLGSGRPGEKNASPEALPGKNTE
ncbi:MAG: tetratricopeptide repeat protein [Desulfomonilaceae bacterium]